MVKSNTTKRTGGSRKASSYLNKLLSPALRRRGFAETEVISRWPEIVGSMLAANCAPERLVFRRGENTEGTLHVRAGGAIAVELQHLEPLVIEKINTYYGYRAVGRLQILQGPLPERGRTKKPPPALLDAAQEAEIEKSVAGTRDSPLRESLAALGRSIFADPSNRTKE